MRRISIFLFLVLFFNIVSNIAFANENNINSIMNKELNYQRYINEIGINILNSNAIDKKIIFTYNKDEYQKSLNDPTITKRQIVFYDEYFKYIDNDDEMAAFLAHEISRAVKSFSGEWGGFVSSIHVKAAPKKYEIFADKRAVDYMVKSGYNPLGLITFLNKTEVNGLLGNLFHNTSTKRQATIYEYIYYNYPYYLQNNTYLENKNYQNFLLNSRENRELLHQKIKSGSKEELKYE